jgi:benzylsuccinate CoA-transferase BbsF subunit
MGAEVIKVESGGRPDPGRASELHSVLGQGKRGISLNLRAPEAVAIARRLVAESDVAVENFATGVMGRLGLGDDVLFELRPDLVMVSASGMGRTGPQADRVAYGTLLQCFTGFAGMNGYPGRPAAVGMAWLDPMCGMLMASAAVAALRERRVSGRGRRIDFSMVEALLWTMPGPLLDYQLTGRTPERAGNDDPRYSPHGVYRCAGDDTWLAVAVTTDEQWHALCSVVGPLDSLDASWALDARQAHAEEVDAELGGWAVGRDANEAWLELQRAGVPAAPSNSSLDLFADAHLGERGFYRLGADVEGVERRLPGLPWQLADIDLPLLAPAAQLGADTDAVLRDVLGLGDEELAELHAAGALE